MVGIVIRTILRKVYTNFQSRADVLLFCLFIVVVPFSVRKIVWFLPLQGGFNEYAHVSLYFSDLVLGSVFIYWWYRHGNSNRGFLSSLIVFWKKISIDSLAHKLIILLPAIIIVWSLFSLTYAREPVIGIFFIFKLIEWYSMFLFMIFRIVPHRTINGLGLLNLQLVLKAIIFSGIVQAVIGIFQVVQQKSIGLSLLKESVISSDTPGVAKIIFNNEVYVRAYGMLPHPNILGGFLFISIIVTMLYFKMFHMEQKDDVYLKVVILRTQYIGIVLTFSKSAILGLSISLVYIFLASRRLKRQCSGEVDFRKDSMSWIWDGRMYSKFAKIVIFVVSAVVTVSMFNRDAFLFQSLRERAWYQSAALNVIYEHPILGISCGQLVIFMSQQRIYTLFSWQLQPVHNVFLLIWSELGVIGFGLFSLWWVLFLGIFLERKEKMFSSDKNDFTKDASVEYNWVNVYGYGMILGIMPILLFDHYMWDIQQGQFVMWFVVSLISGYVVHYKDMI